MYSNILVAIALDHSQDAAKALSIAQMLADDGGAVTALNILEEIPVYATNQIPEQILTDRRSEAKAELAAEVAGFPGVTPVVADGHAGRSILAYAEQKGVDCIVIASHRPGLQDYFMGSTASRVVRHAKCSVHVLR